jgi:hypothetical protein
MLGKLCSHPFLVLRQGLAAVFAWTGLELRIHLPDYRCACEQRFSLSLSPLFLSVLGIEPRLLVC